MLIFLFYFDIIEDFDGTLWANLNIMIHSVYDEKIYSYHDILCNLTAVDLCLIQSGKKKRRKKRKLGHSEQKGNLNINQSLK